MLEFCKQMVVSVRQSLSPRRVARLPKRSAKYHRMILLCGAYEQLLWNDNVYENDDVRPGRSRRLRGTTLLESVECVQYHAGQRCASNSFRMTTFTKKWGVGGSGAGGPTETTVSAVLYLAASLYA